MSRRPIIPLLAAMLVAVPVNAQPSPADLAGTYDGHQTEIGTALQLGADGRFQYYLSYGALDEMAAGTWTVGENGIVLTSDPVKAPAFVLVDSKAGKGSTFDLTLDVPNGMPIQFFSGAALFADGTENGGDFSENRLHWKLGRGQVVSGVALAFQIYGIESGKIGVPPRTGAMHFRFEPNDLGLVAFDHQLLPRDGDAFLLSRYDRTLRFVKEEPREPEETEESEE